MAVRSVVHPSGKTLHFNVKYHSYSLNGTKCRSVSSVLNQFFPFDAVRVGTIVAQKQGKTLEQVHSEWKMSAQLGSNVHAYLEALIRNEPPPKFTLVQGTEDTFLPVAAKALEKLKERYDIFEVETMVASEKYRLAGTIDFLARNKKTGAILIGDWKTTSSQSTGFLFGSFDGPCPGIMSHMPNNKMARYALQTLIYGHLMIEEGYKSVWGPSVVDQPLEYGLIKFGPNQTGDVVAEFVRVTPGSLSALEDSSVSAETLVRKICMSDID